ncbi:hypothetical protein CVT25_005899 [Psilocybe cyanescens]|uniref:Sulfite efflux pump SSU1 n=1 Tax=Psilocybe cyanescens TaxID=93625 RepID=A0A409VM17_PSICY|nr:hypothetical protein CVT25_005899 [Psilocybe cyanescens]
MLVLSLIVSFLNLFLFVLFTILLITKYLCYPDRWKSLIRNPVTSLFAGCFPMAGTTLINVAVQVVHTRYHVGGKGFLYFIWSMWWLDIVVSLLCCWLGVNAMFVYQKHTLQTMSATWLLPIVTLIVAASSGGIIGQALVQYSATYALNTVVVSVFLVVVGLTFALMILTIYLLRLILHGLPPGASLLSVFLPLGPTGQSGYAILLAGQNFRILFPPLSDVSQLIRLGTHENSVGVIVDIICTCSAFLLWSIATMWLLYAVLAIYTGLGNSVIPYRISFWGLVFPNTVYANLTIQLANAFDSRAFRVWGSIYAAGSLILWLSLFLRSVWELKIFFIAHEESPSTATAQIPVQYTSSGSSFSQHRSTGNMSSHSTEISPHRIETSPQSTETSTIKYP